MHMFEGQQEASKLKLQIKGKHPQRGIHQPCQFHCIVVDEAIGCVHYPRRHWTSGQSRNRERRDKGWDRKRLGNG